MKMRDYRRAAAELDQAEAPGKALAEEQIVAVMQGGFSQEFAITSLGFPKDIY